MSGILAHLDLKNSKINDAGLAHFQGLKNLKSLNLASTEISDAGLKQLNSLHLIGNDLITDTGLQHLKSVPALNR